MNTPPFSHRLLLSALIVLPLSLYAKGWLPERQSQTDTTSKSSYQAKVDTVHDGDTLRLTDSDGQKHKIRMAYIDAPEINQAYGQASRDRLKRLVDGRQVSVQVFERDQYGREVAKITVNGQDINLSQLQAGAVWHYVSIAKHKQDKADYVRYQEAEQRARAERTGLWQAYNPQAPWQFRKQQRNSGEQ